jgi:tRNA threonylcarbamoyl adenosine modification protein YeaZ
LTHPPSRTLIIDCATQACSVALIDSDRIVAATHDLVGRGHAEHLLPMIAALPDGGRARRILVDCGPGSFTGVRVGLAAARALGMGWGVPVAGYASTAIIAVAAFAADPALQRLAVVLEGGHGEVFMQPFSRQPMVDDAPLASLLPGAALAALDGRLAVGNGVRHLRALDPDVAVIDALPNAANAVLLPANFTALPPVPIYGRAPDAKTLAERGLG